MAYAADEGTIGAESSAGTGDVGEAHPEGVTRPPRRTIAASVELAQSGDLTAAAPELRALPPARWPVFVGAALLPLALLTAAVVARLDFEPEGTRQRDWATVSWFLIAGLGMVSLWLAVVALIWVTRRFELVLSTSGLRFATASYHWVHVTAESGFVRWLDLEGVRFEKTNLESSYDPVQGKSVRTLEKWIILVSAAQTWRVPWRFEGQARPWVAAIRECARRAQNVARESAAPESEFDDRIASALSPFLARGGLPEDGVDSPDAPDSPDGKPRPTRRLVGGRMPSTLAAVVLVAGAAPLTIMAFYTPYFWIAPLGLAVASVAFAPLARLLQARAAQRAIGRAVERTWRAERARVDLRAACEQGIEATLRGRIRARQPVMAPDQTPCAAYVAREGAPGVRGVQIASAAGTLELQTEGGEHIDLEPGAWRVADPFDASVLGGEALILDGCEVVVRAPVVRRVGELAGYRETQSRLALAPGWLAPARGRFSRARPAKWSRARAVTRWTMLGLAALALAIGALSRMSSSGSTAPDRPGAGRR